MQRKPKLYLFLGYPGAGKTTVSKIISEASGAVHLWADVERHKMFEEPTHSKEESDQLYKYLNNKADQLLSEGKDVVFDTNFNFYEDRQKLREIAEKNNAETILIWITTPEDIARSRAVNTHTSRNLYEMSMTNEQFNNIVKKLEPPRENQQTVRIDCSDVNPASVKQILGLQS